KCLHSTATLDEAKRYICHFPQDGEIWAINSGYGGNAMLSKKCLALRLASWRGKREGWLAEHMLIIGVQAPDGNITYVCAAFPSACGKTNMAMMVPPSVYAKKGYKVWCVGDDIAWLRIGDDGRLWAINPENGFFGVAPGTSAKSNPCAFQAIGRDTIFTNVVYDNDDGTVWWEGMGTEPPENALDWKGDAWNGKTSREKGAHPNSRFTAPAKNCPVLSAEFENPRGVPISAIVFGGRRAKTAPLVYQARDFRQGVFVGSILASETTAAQTGSVGVVRSDSMAMRPFVGYDMGEYLGHWLEMGERLGDKAPAVFAVNWFRAGDDGRFMWPGFGENMRALEWILSRAKGEGGARETPIGLMPGADDINVEGLSIERADLEELLRVDRELWLEEAARIREYYGALGASLPAALAEELAGLEARLGQCA
ncbi:MAG: phosphoenolpyruvate carboxykinase (GTP), partial [Treponema sp.]|nr:phosphoenolpyruvate carboxykinase (GTP) [Treponema sp.]